MTDAKENDDEIDDYSGNRYFGMQSQFTLEGMVNMSE